MGGQSWSVAEAKARFSEVLEKAHEEGPQTITRHGKSTAVVVAAREWQEKTKRKGSLADFFASSPLRSSGLRLRRLPARLRKIEL